MRKLLSLSTILCLLTTTSCASLFNRGVSHIVRGVQTGDSRDPTGYRDFYPGTRFAFDFLIRSERLYDDPDRQMPLDKHIPVAIFATIPDIPASFAFDTVLLPVDLIVWLNDDDSPDES